MTLKLLSLVALSFLGIAMAAPAPELTWPGFRGHDMSGVAPKATLPDTWSTTQNVKWSAPIAGNGWSSPIVWGDTVYVTTAIGAKRVQEADPQAYSGTTTSPSCRPRGSPAKS